MNYQEAARMIEAARRNPEVLATDAYIEAQLSRPGLIQGILFGMGPNCNRRCWHCYGDYGPDRKGLPSARMVASALEGAVSLGVLGAELSDGEPMRHENRKVVRLFAQHSRDIPLIINTNAVFARTQANATQWMKFLRENGFDLSRDGNQVVVSFGSMYDVHWSNYYHLNVALKKTFPEADFGNHLQYRFVRDGRESLDAEHLRLRRVGGCLIGAFGKSGKTSVDTTGPLQVYLVHPEKGSDIHIAELVPDPAGRAKNLAIFDRDLPVKDLTIESIGFFPDDSEHFLVASNGDVGFGINVSDCLQKGRVYGNIANTTLVEIFRDIAYDVVYHAFKLGGIRFMQHLAMQEKSELRFRGRIRCDVCRPVFEDSALVGTIRTSLRRNGVVKEYKRYLDQRGLPKPLV